jgi:hypothetical protein
MAKFTLTFIEDRDNDDSHYEIIDTIARQHNLDVGDVQAFVERFVDGNTVTLQFDTEKQKCFVLYAGKEGVNDFKDERDVILKTTNIHDRYFEGRAVYIATLQTQLDEAAETYKQEGDKKSAAAKNLLRFIEDVRQELNGLKAVNGGESNSSYLV